MLMEFSTQAARTWILLHNIHQPPKDFLLDIFSEMWETLVDINSADLDQLFR